MWDVLIQWKCYSAVDLIVFVKDDEVRGRVVASLNGTGKGKFFQPNLFKLAPILIPTHAKVVTLQVSDHTYLHNLHTYRKQKQKTYHKKM